MTESHCRRAWLAAMLAVVAVACGGARHAGSTPGAGRPFTFSTIGSSYGVQARIEGTVAAQQRWVYLVAPRGAVRTYQLDRQDYWDLRLRAAIATCKGRNVEVASEGRAARLLPILGLSRDAATLDTTTLAFKDTLRVDVGIPPGTDLARSWIALIFEWPFQNVLATYTEHLNLPLNPAYGPWTGMAARVPGERCR